MKFARLNGSPTETSDCGEYDLRPSWHGGHFAWRGRHIATDKLIQASADRGYVVGCCERHRDKAIAEAEVS